MCVDTVMDLAPMEAVSPTPKAVRLREVLRDLLARA
jgi:hypothetical protein